MEDSAVEYITSWEQMGIEKGIEQGIEQGVARVLLEQLAQKFGTVSKEIQDRVSEADAETVLRWAKRLLDAERAEDLFDGDDQPE